MTHQEWQQVWNVYRATAELPAAERAPVLESELPDSLLRGTVEKILDRLEADGQDEPAPPAEWRLLGHTLGRFELRRPLGRGGMGEVYAAYDSDLCREVAIKCVAPTNLGSSQAIADFLREARSVSALNHPGIVTVYEVIRIEETVAIVMEFVDGVSLRTLASNAQPVLEVAGWGRQIAGALAACHARGIVHRDIKPENLMLRQDGFIKTLDFGLAADRSAPSQSSPVGTVRYMSPEQGRGEPVTAATDIFSLGIVLFELATGIHPFASGAAGNATMALVAAISGCDAGPPSRLRQGIPADFDQLLREMLAKDPELRPSAADVVRRLDLICRPGHKPSRRRWYALTAAVTLAAGASLLWHPARSAIDPNRLQIVPFTSYQGSETQPAFSPDGTKITFVWTGEKGDNKDIYVKGVADGRLVRLTYDPAEDLLPVFSPDGGHIAFLRQTAGVSEPEVMMMRSDGSDLHSIVKIAPSYGYIGLTWWPDGKSLVVHHSEAGRASLFRLNFQNGSLHRITFPPQGLGDGRPAFSPDRKWLAFVRYSAATEQICMQPVAGGADQCLVKASGPDIAWMPDSKSILYSSANALWTVSIGPTAGPVRIVNGSFTGLTIDRSGRQIAFSRSFTDANIWSIASDGRANTRLIASSGEDSSPNWSPDGKHIVMRSNRSGTWELYTYNADGSGEKQITNFNAKIDNPVWSPDSAWIAFDGNRAPVDRAVKHHNVYIVPSGGGSFRRLTDDAFHYEMPAWSGDGLWLYYLKEAATAEETWKMPIEGGKPVLVDRHTLQDLVESPDGQYLYYVRGDGPPGIRRRQIADNHEEALRGAEEVQLFRYWSVSRNGVFFVPGPPDPFLRFLDLRNHRISRVARLSPNLIKGPRGLAASPDGSTILYTVEDIVAADIMLGRM